MTGALTQAVPTGLLDAFWAYETAVLSNDQTTLNALFAPGKDTVRGDGKVLLVGHKAIAGFRSARAKIPTRRRRATIPACSRFPQPATARLTTTGIPACGVSTRK